MNWMTIPAMIGPMVGPIVGGALTSYASWRWIFYLNIPIGLLGGVVAWWLFENFRAPAPARFDLTGFAVAGLGLFLLEFAIENLGRPIIAPAAGIVFFPLAVALLIAYGRHARQSPSPVLDLTLLKIKTFNIGTVTGGICRMGLDATPFMLPLLFQVGFGLSPVAAGMLSRSTSVGGVVQQLARGFGVAIGAALLAMIAGSERVTTEDFRIVFLLVALIPLFSAFGFLRLNSTDGAEVSGHPVGQPALKTG